MRQHDGLVFSLKEYQRRLDAVRAQMVEREVDAIIVTTPENLTYLTGYHTPGYYYFQCLVVPLAGEPFMVTRRLEDSNVRTRTWIETSRPYEDIETPVVVLADMLKQHNLRGKRVGFEKHSYFFRATEQDILFAACTDTKFTDISGLVERCRVVKSADEIAIMHEASKGTEAGMRAGIDAISVGANENFIAAEIHHAMCMAGSQYTAIAPFVASGPRCSIGHATWEGREVQADEIVFLEIGGCVHRYHTAMMRSVYTGAPTDAMYEAEEIIIRAVDECMAAMKPGVTAGTIDAIAREVLATNSFGAEQATRTGYSIGIAFAPDWGEGHIISLQKDDPRVLEENMVFHLIPWIQIPNVAGIGISETVQVTPDGAKSFFTFERKLFTA